MIRITLDCVRPTVCRMRPKKWTSKVFRRFFSNRLGF